MEYIFLIDSLAIHPILEYFVTETVRTGPEDIFNLQFIMAGLKFGSECVGAKVFDMRLVMQIVGIVFLITFSLFGKGHVLLHLLEPGVEQRRVVD